MAARQTYSTRLINSYSNKYISWKVARTLRKTFGRKAKDLLEGRELQLPRMPGRQPLIILGMHRSGTTMLSEVIREMGIFMGWLRGSDTDESVYFQNINRAIFRLAKAAWDEPDGLQHALRQKEVKKLLVATLAEMLENSHPSYLGARRQRTRSLLSLGFDWGFKDPRTVFTYPLWQELFPTAKLLYIYRHGVDVANSLHVRNKNLLQSGDMSLRCLELQGAYELWEEYNEACREIIAQSAQGRTLSFCYEDLLANPAPAIVQIRDFLGADVDEAAMDRIVAGIRPSRAYAYQQDARLQAFYESVRERPLMKALGYDQL